MEKIEWLDHTDYGPAWYVICRGDFVAGPFDTTDDAREWMNKRL